MNAGGVTLKFSDILDLQDSNAEKIKSVVDEFTSSTSNIAKQGNEIILDVVYKLTPEERSKSAEMIRQRAAHMPRN